jgi:saccharopine dehydrogenase-like NADP-dependent oxidoreductase
LALEHQIPSWQVCEGKKRKFPPFAGYQKEKFFGIAAESYYCASGFENILEKAKVQNFSCRVVRPLGFREFFAFLKNEGFLNKDNQAFTKQVVEANAEDNITLAQINISAKDKKVRWTRKASSKKNEALNSMQKITAAVPAAMAGFLVSGRIKKPGLLFMEDIGRDETVFKSLLSGIKNVVAARRSIGG